MHAPPAMSAAPRGGLPRCCSSSTHPVRDVVHHDDAVRSPVVGAGDGPEALLPSGVPLRVRVEAARERRDSGHAASAILSIAARTASPSAAGWGRTICSLTVLSPIFTVRKRCRRTRARREGETWSRRDADRGLRSASINVFSHKVDTDGADEALREGVVLQVKWTGCADGRRGGRPRTLAHHTRRSRTARVRWRAVHPSRHDCSASSALRCRPGEQREPPSAVEATAGAPSPLSPSRQASAPRARSPA